MALTTTHKEVTFGVGDNIKVIQNIREGEKTRFQTFEGIVIKIKGREENQSFTVRRIGVQQIGIERIFPTLTPTIERIEVVRKGTRGVRRAKLYYIRDKSKKEIERIYTRAKKKEESKKKSSTGSKGRASRTGKLVKAKRTSVKKTVEKVSTKKTALKK
ncbi:50S ribosomal protein L19 [Patescibacteria group bacterium]|nr:50S ribosomal protein L19 [Patescibacteria group bacterium]